MQSYSDRLTQILPPVRPDPRRAVESTDLPLERAPVVCTTIMTAAYVKDNVPLLQRFIIDRCITDAPRNVPGRTPEAVGTPPDPPLNSSLHSSKRMSEKERERNEEEARWERVTLDPAIRALETLEASALKVLDIGLMTQLTKFIDGPLLPGPGIQVMSANLAAWRLEQVCITAVYRGVDWRAQGLASLCRSQLSPTIQFRTLLLFIFSYCLLVHILHAHRTEVATVQQTATQRSVAMPAHVTSGQRQTRALAQPFCTSMCACRQEIPASMPRL